MRPQGIETPQRPARFAGTVNASQRYACSGSFTVESSLKAGVGATGQKIASTFANAASKSRRTSVRTLSARL